MESNMDSVQQTYSRMISGIPLILILLFVLAGFCRCQIDWDWGLEQKHRQEWETRITQLSALSSRLETETKNLFLGMKFQTYGLASMDTIWARVSHDGNSKGFLSPSGGGHMLVFAFFFIYLPINVPTLAGSI